MPSILSIGKLRQLLPPLLLRWDGKARPSQVWNWLREDRKPRWEAMVTTVHSGGCGTAPTLMLVAVMIRRSNVVIERCYEECGMVLQSWLGDGDRSDMDAANFDI